jgi:hypothetical protein
MIALDSQRHYRGKTARSFAETACEIAHNAFPRKRYGCDYCGHSKFRGRSVGGMTVSFFRTPVPAERGLAADRLDSHLGGARTLILPDRPGPATRESA